MGPGPRRRNALFRFKAVAHPERSLETSPQTGARRNARGASDAPHRRRGGPGVQIRVEAADDPATERDGPFPPAYGTSAVAANAATRAGGYGTEEKAGGHLRFGSSSIRSI